MKIPGYYSSGEFARMAHVTLRTVRYYDKKNILKPSFVTESGARFYTDQDFARLQQILLLKYLGFSLEEIREMTIEDNDYKYMLNSLNLQKKLVEDRIEQLENVKRAIENTTAAIETDHKVDWTQMLKLIHLTEMQESLKSQYKSSSNISARIRLHKNYSQNKEGWFPWILRLLLSSHQVPSDHAPRFLELGCGDGSLWLENARRIPEKADITLTDISDGMIRDARRSLSQNPEILSSQKEKGYHFHYGIIDAQRTPYRLKTEEIPDQSFDYIMANHVLFYCHDIPQIFEEIHRILKDDGLFLCTAYSGRHMHEIRDLAQKFDSRIVLSGEKLYDVFGLDNGADLLRETFASVKLVTYPDAIELDQAEPLIEYILSCHGNQNQYLLERYNDFRSFVEKNVADGFHITKDSGAFLARKQDLSR